MIRLIPYYERDNGSQMLNCFLKMVADVVPFFREDVLDDENSHGKLGKPRQRRDSYPGNLNNRFPGISDTKKEKGEDIDRRKRFDAQLAEQLIREYSPKLHEYLYEGCAGDGHINRSHLRNLLTVRLTGGEVPDKWKFDDAGDGTLLLAHVFRYDTLTTHPDLYSYINSISAQVCPYCNRIFTTTVTDKNHKTRPQLDHFRNKNKYPYLALSINNLVPSCGVCNHLKHNDDLDMIYPYEEGMEKVCSFRTTIPKQHITTVLTGARIAPENFELTLSSNLTDENSPQATRIRNSIDKLALKPLYDTHKNYVTDLYFQRYIMTDKLIQDISGQFSNLFHSEEEVQAALLATCIQEEHWGDRPLSKLTHDILEEIEMLYSQIRP